MRVAAAGGEDDGSSAQSSRLALNTCEPSAVVDDEVVSSVLAKRQENLVTGALEPKHDREGRPITDGLRVFHRGRVAVASDGNKPRGYDFRTTPE
jgi:hypothetical protein